MLSFCTVFTSSEVFYRILIHCTSIRKMGNLFKTYPKIMFWRSYPRSNLYWKLLGNSSRSCKTSWYQNKEWPLYKSKKSWNLVLGAIIGDISGLRFERNDIKAKDFVLFDDRRCRPKDDSVMSLAIAKALMKSMPDYSNLAMESISCMQNLGKKYPHAGNGGSFKQWLRSNNSLPYHSWGNGSAMRVSACGYAASSVEPAVKLSRDVSSVTHNHPEGIKGAESIVVIIFMVLHGSSMLEIQDYSGILFHFHLGSSSIWMA